MHRRAKSSKNEAVHFIDVTDWDIGLHRYMTMADRVEKAVVAEALRLSLSWLPSKWTTGEKQLFEYCKLLVPFLVPCLLKLKLWSSPSRRVQKHYQSQ